MREDHGAEHIERHENRRVQCHQTHQPFQKYQLIRCQGAAICPQVERTECAYDQDSRANYRVYLDKQAKNALFTVQIAFRPILGKISDNGTADAEIQQADIAHNRLRDPVNTVLGLSQHTEHNGRIDEWDQITDQQIQIGQQRACFDLVTFHAFASSSNALRASSARAI